MVALGNPTTDLVFAEHELRAVTDGLKQLRTAFARDATEARVRGWLEDAGLVYLATHGKLERLRPPCFTRASAVLSIDVCRARYRHGPGQDPISSPCAALPEPVAAATHWSVGS